MPISTPMLTVDIIIAMRDRPGRPVVLIERRNPPHGWALPGGFVDVGERLEAAARREAREETSLQVELEFLLGCYSDPQRDARGHSVSAVYVASAEGCPRARDDAVGLCCVFPGECPPLVFDHDQIMDDYRSYLAHGTAAPLRG